MQRPNETVGQLWLCAGAATWPVLCPVYYVYLLLWFLNVNFVGIV